MYIHAGRLAKGITDIDEHIEAVRKIFLDGGDNPPKMIITVQNYIDKSEKLPYKEKGLFVDMCDELSVNQCFIIKK